MNGRSILSVILHLATNVILWGIVGILVGIFFLMRGLEAHNAAAYIALGGVVALALVILGVLLTLFILWVANRQEERRERQEQERFTTNARENLAIMASMQRVQNAQNSMLLRQAREAKRALPDNDVIDIDALVADDSVFDELEG
jgi:thiol:disulfide interchange protein